MAYQLYCCAKTIYCWQSGQTLKYPFLCVLVTTDDILMVFFFFSSSCICVPLKKRLLGSLMLKRTTLLLLSHVSINIKAKNGLWLCQISDLSTLSICNEKPSTDIGLTTCVVRFKPCEQFSVYDRCMICAEDQQLLRRPLYLKKIITSKCKWVFVKIWLNDILN